MVPNKFADNENGGPNGENLDLGRDIWPTYLDAEKLQH